MALGCCWTKASETSGFKRIFTLAPFLQAGLNMVWGMAGGASQTPRILGKLGLVSEASVSTSAYSDLANVRTWDDLGVPRIVDDVPPSNAIDFGRLESVPGNALVNLSRAERLAYDDLTNLEGSIEGAHFLKRHGSLTTLEQQQVRAATGLTPDGKVLSPIDSSRWFNHGDMLEGLQRAESVYARTGNPTVRVEFDRIIGEGYLRGGDVYSTTNVANFVFRNGRPYTFYPVLDVR